MKANPQYIHTYISHTRGPNLQSTVQLTQGIMANMLNKQSRWLKPFEGGEQ